jgi:phosphocarrier protein HPr
VPGGHAPSGILHFLHVPVRQRTTRTGRTPVMVERTVIVASRVGLHARPAMLFTQAAAASGLAVTIARPGGEPVDAASILFVMSLGVPNGEEVTLTADGPGADGVLDELVALLATDLDAPDSAGAPQAGGGQPSVAS